ncbi:cytochrome P450 [Micrococcaceae sp. AOP34-BR2-30]
MEPRQPAPDFSLDGNDEPAHVFGIYDRLRTETPAAYTEDEGGYWTLTRFADVRDAALDSETFISSVKAVVPSDPRGIRRPPLNFDAPRHTPFRRALIRTMTSARVADIVDELRPRAQVLFEEFLEECRRGDARGADISKGFGTMLPAAAACLWLGLEDERSAWLAETATLWVDAWRRQDGEEVTRYSERMYEVARWLVEDRQREPRDTRVDPASSLLSEIDDGAPLDVELIVGALRQSLVVGMVAPPLLIGSIAAHLAEDAGLRRRLQQEPELRSAAVEEFIRLYSPYRGFARTASRVITVGDREIHPREPITLSYAAANRDPAQFSEPNAFRLDRENAKDHLGFGKGRHQCVGMHLARGVIRIALDLIVEHDFMLMESPTPTRMPELGFQTVRLGPRGTGCPFS